MIILLFIIYVIFASGGLILFKVGSINSNLSVTLFGLKINFSFKMLLGILCYGISFLLWMFIVSKTNLTVAMPLSVAFVNLLVIVESCLFLKEKITLTQGIGILTILIGVCVMITGVKK